MDRGWIKIHRKLLDNTVFYNPVRLQLFLYLLVMSNHKPNKVFGIELVRGQHITGRKKLSSTLNCSESLVYKNLKALQKNDLITLKSNNKHTIVTICNYDTYQDAVTTNGQQSNNKVTTKEQQSNTNKNDKKEKNYKKNTEVFEFLWKLYERKGNRKSSLNNWNKLTVKQKDEVKLKVRAYVDSTPEKRYRKSLEVYLNKSREYWNDELVGEGNNAAKSNPGDGHRDLSKMER